MTPKPTPHSRNYAGMGLPSDLKHYKARVDSFQIIEEGSAAVSLIALVVLCLIFWPYFV